MVAAYNTTSGSAGNESFGVGPEISEDTITEVVDLAHSDDYKITEIVGISPVDLENLINAKAVTDLGAIARRYDPIPGLSRPEPKGINAFADAIDISIRSGLYYASRDETLYYATTEPGEHVHEISRLPQTDLLPALPEL